MKIKVTILKEKFFLKNQIEKMDNDIDWYLFEDTLNNLIEGEEQIIQLKYKNNLEITISSGELIIVEG